MRRLFSSASISLFMTMNVDLRSWVPLKNTNQVFWCSIFFFLQLCSSGRKKKKKKTSKCDFLLSIFEIYSIHDIYQESVTFKSIKLHASNAIDNVYLARGEIDSTNILLSAVAGCVGTLQYILVIYWAIYNAPAAPPHHSHCNSKLHYRFSHLPIWSHNESLGYFHYEWLSFLRRNKLL